MDSVGTMMRAMLEHLGAAPGHADRSCGDCDRATVTTGWFCLRWDTYLRSGTDGKPVKCFDCCRRGDLDGGND